MRNRISQGMMNVGTGRRSIAFCGLAVGMTVALCLVMLPGCPAGNVGACQGDPCADGDPCTVNVCTPDRNAPDGRVCTTTPVECPDGQVCSPDDGMCVEGEDPCEGVTCDEGEECVDGECVAGDPCEGVTCDEGEECVDGECVPTGNGGGDGDAAAGKTFYDANCAGCHAADASGNIGPNIQGFDAAQVQAGVEGAAVHASITISADDYANLGAYLSTLP